MKNITPEGAKLIQKVLVIARRSEGFRPCLFANAISSSHFLQVKKVSVNYDNFIIHARMTFYKLLLLLYITS